MARELRVVIAGDTSRLSSAYGKATGDTHSFGRAVSGVAGTALKGLAVGAGIAGVAVAIGMKKSLDAAGDFQSKMAVLQATTHGTNSQMAAASKLAVKLGADARLPAVSAGDAADAMLQLGKAGFTVQKSMAAARGTLLLATAAETDGATAAKVVTQNLNAFGLKAKDTSKIVDQMAGFMNATGTDFTAFADSLTYTAAISHTVGQSFADTTTQLTILSQAGIEGSQAGTGLRTILAGLGAEGSKASKVFAKVGVDTVGANGKFVGMRSVIQQLTPVFDKMTSSQRLTFLQTAFGKTAMNQANIVLGESVAKYDAAKAAVDRKGQADKLAASHMTGYKGAIAQLGSALETLQISMGTKLLPVATRVAHFLTNIASAPSISVAIKIALSGIKSLAGDARKQLSDALFGSNRTVTIGGEGRATRVVFSQGIIQQIQAFDWGRLLNGSSKTITVGGEGRSNAVVVSPGLLGSISTAFQAGMAKIDWSAVGKTAGAAIGASITITAAGFDKFGQVAMAWANSHAGQLAEIGATIGLNVVSKLLSPSFWLQHWELIGGIAISIFPVSRFGALGGKLAEAAFGKLGALVEPLVLRALEALPSKLQGPALRIALAIGDGIAKGIPAAAGKMVDLGERLIGAVAKLGGRFGTLIKVAINTGIVAAIGGLIGAAASKAEQLATAIANAIKTAPAKLSGLAGDLLNKLQSIVTSVATTAYSLAMSIGGRIGDGVLAGLTSLPGRLKDKLVGIASSAVDLAGKALPGSGPWHFTIHKIGEPMVEGILIGIRNGEQSIRAQLISGIRSAVESAKTDALSQAGSLGSTIGDAITARAAKAIAKLDTSPLGVQLAQLNAQIQGQQNAEQETGLMQSLAAAQAGSDGVVDPAAVQQAQQALDDWRQQQQATNLATLLQQQKDEIQAEADAKSTAFQTGLTNLQDSLNRGLISQKTYEAGVQKLLSDSGETYKSIGNSLGSSFANGFRDQIKALADDTSTILSGKYSITIAKRLTAGALAVQSAGTGKGGFHGFADGAIVKGGRGGVRGLVGEGRDDELITPLNSNAGRRALASSGGETHVHLHLDGPIMGTKRDVGNYLIDAVLEASRNGNRNLKLAL